MFFRCIMADRCVIREPGERTADQVALSWMETPTRRINAQSPTDLADALPSRYRQAVIVKLRNAAPVHWCWPHTARSKGIIVARLIRRRTFLHTDQRLALIPTI